MTWHRRPATAGPNGEGPRLSPRALRVSVRGATWYIAQRIALRRASRLSNNDAGQRLVASVNTSSSRARSPDGRRVGDGHLRGRRWSAGDPVSRTPPWLSGSRRPADTGSVDRGRSGRETEPLADGVVLPHGVRAHVARRVAQGRGRGLRHPFGPDGGGPGRGWHGAVTNSKVGHWRGTTACPTDRRCRSAAARMCAPPVGPRPPAPWRGSGR